MAMQQRSVSQSASHGLASIKTPSKYNCIEKLFSNCNHLWLFSSYPINVISYLKFPHILYDLEFYDTFISKPDQFTQDFDLGKINTIMQKSLLIIKTVRALSLYIQDTIFCGLRTFDVLKVHCLLSWKWLHCI